MANPFSQTINWFQLSLDRQKIYKIICPKEETKPENYYIQFEENFYSLEKDERSCQMLWK